MVTGPEVLERAATPRGDLQLQRRGEHYEVISNGVFLALTDPRPEQVTVVEIEERIIAWNRSHLAPFSGNALANSRTRIVHADLVQWLHATDEQFDVICLDIDNGPDWTVFADNQGLYQADGLAMLWERLAPGGAVSFWSAAAAPRLAEQLASRFRAVEVIAVAVAVPHAEPDYIYVAVR